MGHMAKETDICSGIVGVVDTCCEKNDLIGVSHRTITQEVPSLTQDSQNCVMFSLKTKVKE